MLHTPLCDRLGIAVPLLVAPFGPWSEVDLAVAAAEAGCLASLGTAVRSVPELQEQWRAVRDRTARPFVINHTGRPFNEAAFAATLDAAPAAISFHMGIPSDLIARAHDRGITWLQTVGDAESAERALEAGADVLIAQGGEAGGNSGWVATMVLVPQVVDVAGDIPVIAAGGIADGRGLAAALALGAQGASLGTRFLAATEMPVADAWKQRIVAADALDAVKVVNSERVMPRFNRPGGPAEPRSLSTPLTEQLRDHPEWIDPQVMGPRVREALLVGRGHEYIPFTGQSAGLIDDVLPAAEIVGRIVAEAEEALSRARAAP